MENIEKRIEQLEFKIKLVNNGSDLSHFIVEQDVTKEQFDLLLQFVERFRALIDENKPVNSCEFEDEVYKIIPQKNGDYHFCISFTKLLASEGRYAEVKQTLYNGK